MAPWTADLIDKTPANEIITTCRNAKKPSIIPIQQVQRQYNVRTYNEF